ncbi:hypothetical protein IID62_04930 [candidate division KSB1 bacterium]|nr:hypothetical protein [candidate division KSB1 bacterium]
MFRKSSIMMLVLLLAVASVSYAQRGGRGRARAVFLLDKEAAAELLGIVDSQMSEFNKEVDELVKIYEPYLKESAELAEKLGLPETVVTAGLGFGGRRGGRGRGGGGDFQATMESYRTYITEDNKLRKKYEDKIKDLDQHLGNIEKMLTDGQKEIFNYTRPQRGGRRGRGGGGAGRGGGGGGGVRGSRGGGGFQQQLIKPSFDERQTGFGRN